MAFNKTTRQTKNLTNGEGEGGTLLSLGGLGGSGGRLGVDDRLVHLRDPEGAEALLRVLRSDLLLRLWLLVGN